ncbi:22496_t:CDS:2 [Dentiscutata erythropus]|uniref:22496_t:CDS:1 n=1 Tax=Dentiscutata erythropus TaxID=1348616 RepID=A0A9N9C717_9GLOM|nr:22496_t:CDS:2 [Dentiscutata erythropus]
MFILEFMVNDDQTILITSPHRFGKSTNLSMLHTFFEPVSEKIQKFAQIKFCMSKFAHWFDWLMKVNFDNWPIINAVFNAFNVSKPDISIPLYKATNETYFTRVLGANVGLDQAKISSWTIVKFFILRSLIR